MLFTHLLSVSLLIALSTQTAVVGQISSQPVLTQTSVRLPRHEPSDRRTTLATADESDSLLIKRNFFSSTIIQQGNRLNRRFLIELLEEAETPQALVLYRRGQLLKPMGPLLIAAGLVIGYSAVKGTQKTAYARGIGTPANPSPPDVLVDYTSRSLPQLLGGVGLLIGGLCLIEISNDLTVKSIGLYNTEVTPDRSAAKLQTIKLGLTAGGHLGIKATF